MLPVGLSAANGRYSASPAARARDSSSVLSIALLTTNLSKRQRLTVDGCYAPEIAAAAQGQVTPFRTAFPDVRMEAVGLIGEGDTVIGHFRCSGTQTGEWMGRPPTGRDFRDVREVYWFTVRGGRIVD